ncbi:thioesterase family protein [Rhodococcoides kyotonense]|uniref:Thioesterase-like superfamily protein n=1 Tax=Rhodococcoides kyotonense TaxID=398843 RepID=A0A239CJT6_9NOCA|nr:thioesterase family protein [Rhodococcus kyotonensis]SNS20445.1 Thioesterase-like superfamily protein [Rhodococcus kyotonensis]
MTADAFYVPLGADDDGYEVFRTTERTVSLWAPTMQHGAPPSALLVRALERVSPRADVQLTRVVVELLGPVPIADITVRSWIERPGRSIELAVAELWARSETGASRAVARGTAWRMATAATSHVSHVADPPLEPVSEATDHVWSGLWESGYLENVEMKALTKLGGPGPGQVWARPKPALVEGESMTPLERLFSIADIANGIGATLDLDRWTFLNTDLTVHVFREPVGDWIGVSAETSTGPSGFAMSAGVLHDERGPVGRIAQTVLVRPRA